MRILSITSGHDASATIVNDGQIELFLKEERYSRKKHDDGYLNIFNQLLISGKLESLDGFRIASAEDQRSLDNKIKLLRSINPKIIKYELSREHHIFHGMVSFYNSGYDKSLLVVIDAAGGYVDECTFECDSVYIAEYPAKITPLYKRYWTSKNIKKKEVKSKTGCDIVCTKTLEYICIGNLYNSAALSIGQTIEDCGKAMGLSSYGNPILNKGDFDLFKKNSAHKIYDYFKDYSELIEVLTFKKDKFNLEITKDNYQFFADYCYEVQQQCLEKVCEIVEKYVEQTGINRVCLSGGYAMNIVTNYELTKRFPDVEFYFEPLCDDSGLSIGSAMYIYRRVTKDSRINPIQTTAYHGFHHDVSNYIGKNCDIKQVANLLYQNKSVGVFCGLAEAGQRALGNRSILFNALNPDAKDIVNKIKHREWYRPFAAMVLEEDAHLYFENIVSNEYMTVCFPVKSDIIPGVTHVDGTCRVQTVSSGHMYAILQEFKKLTGHGILLNTSFNLAGQPLVETPDEAFATLNESSLDYLWFYETKQLFKSTF